MTRKFAFLLAMVLCSTGVVLTPDRASAQTNLTRAVVQALRNTVKLLPNNRQARPARVRDQLYPKDALSTDRGSRADLRFNDGSLARIGERTLFRFTPKTRRFQLNNGTVLLLIPPGKGRTQINTPNAAAGIRGSALFVRYIPETDTTLIGALTNSQIEVFNEDETQTQPLAAGQLAVVVKDRIERLYEFDLRTFYETSPMVEGLDLSGKQSSRSTDEAIAQVQAETIEAVRSQQQIIGGAKLDFDKVASVPRTISNGFSEPVPITSNSQRVENLDDRVNSVPTSASEEKRPELPPNKPPEDREEDGGSKRPDLTGTPNPVAPVGSGIRKVSASPNLLPGSKNEDEQETSPGSGIGEERPKDEVPGSEGSGSQDQPSPGQGEGERDRPTPRPPQSGNSGSGENRDRPTSESPKVDDAGLGEGDRKAPTKVEAERPRESLDVARSSGNNTQPKVPEAARPVLSTTPVRSETAVRSPDVAAPVASFSAPTITGNTDPNPTAIAPIAIIDPVPAAPVVSAPGNPASIPAPPVSAAAPATNPPVSSVTQPSSAGTPTTGATPAVDPDPSTAAPPIRAGIDPGSSGSPPTPGGVSTGGSPSVGVSISPPTVAAPIDPVDPGNSGNAIDPVAPLPDPAVVTDPTGGPIPVKPGPILDPVDPVGKNGSINQPPIDPGSTPPDPSTLLNPPTTPVVDPAPIDPGSTAPNLPVVIDPPTPVIDPPAVNTPVIDPPVVNTPVIDPPVVNTPVIDPPVVNTPVIDPPVINTPVIDPPIANTPAIDPSTLPVNNLPIDPTSTINPINNTAPTAVDPNTPKAPIDPPIVDPNAPKAPVDPGAGLPGNANSGNPNGMGNPNPGNPNGNPNPGNPNVPGI